MKIYVNQYQSPLLKQNEEKCIDKNQRVKIVTVSWNLQGRMPPIQEISKLFKLSIFQEADIILILTQECLRSLCMSFFCQSKTEWENILIDILGQNYKMLCSETMQGLHTGVFINKKYEYVKLFLKSNLKAGFLNLFGNKGAISIQLQLYNKNLQIINCHLASGQQQTIQRNNTIIRIITQLSSKDLNTQIILGGDFNYRMDIDQITYSNLVKNFQYNLLTNKLIDMINRDQLSLQTILSQKFKNQYQQYSIKFPPMYKLSIDKNQYSPERIPGWTDRIFNRIGKLRQLSYICNHQIKGSDHRPILAEYILPIDNNDSKKQKIFQNQDRACMLI